MTTIMIHDTDDMNSESVLPTCTQQPYSEPSIDNSDSSTNQLVDKDDRAWNVTPMACPVMMYSLLPNVLERVARENGFAIHNVPYVTVSRKTRHIANSMNF